MVNSIMLTAAELAQVPSGVIVTLGDYLSSSEPGFMNTGYYAPARWTSMERPYKDERETCKRCERRSCVGFQVPDAIWMAVVFGRWNVLCLPCFDELATNLEVAWSHDIELFPVDGITGSHCERVELRAHDHDRTTLVAQASIEVLPVRHATYEPCVVVGPTLPAFIVRPRKPVVPLNLDPLPFPDRDFVVVLNDLEMVA